MQQCDEDFEPFDFCSGCPDQEKCLLWDCCQMMIEEDEDYKDEP